MEYWSAILGGPRGDLRPMAQGENVVANIAKYDNNRFPLRAVSMHAVRTSVKDNKIMKTARKGCMLTAL